MATHRVGGLQPRSRSHTEAGQLITTVRRWLIVSGILGIIGGTAAILVPAVASVTTVLFIGWILVYAGVVKGIHAFSRRGREDIGVSVLDALLALLVGLYLVIFPLSGTITLTLLLVVWFAGVGVLSLIAAWRARGLPGRGMLAFGGVLSLVLGILVAVDLPSSAAWAIGLLVGVNLIYWGVRALVAASALKALSRAQGTGQAGAPSAPPAFSAGG
jgi:uncharacterized membrane protein HdeD (DUF308 family)